MNENKEVFIFFTLVICREKYVNEFFVGFFHVMLSKSHTDSCSFSMPTVTTGP